MRQPSLQLDSQTLHWRLPLIGLGLVLTLLWPLQLAHGHTGNTYTVEMGESGFSPERLEILQGDTVVFENMGSSDHWPASNDHPTHELYPDFDAHRPITPGTDWAFIMFRPGAWGIHDHLNPEFTAQIVVLPDTHQVGTTDSNEPSTTEQSALVRVFTAARQFLVRIYDAATQFVAEAFMTQVSGEPAPAATPEVNTEFEPPPDMNLGTAYRQLQLDCPADDFDCFETLFREQTTAIGPAVTIDLLLRLREEGRVSSTVDEHQLGHRIGRQTAESYGVNEQAFLLCPMSSLNGGCQHGFFEYVLGRTESTSEAADLICQSLQEGYSSKFQFYCYHGVGHGVMMASAYDLDRALTTCDTFSTYTAQDGCWQGVFMENVNAGMGGYAREGVFSERDPLEPCNVVDDKYKHECYVNHAGWLMDYFDTDVRSASAACLEAADNWIGSCLQSIGLMVTNPVWQPDLFGDIEGIAFERVAWELCKQFPADWQDQCVIGAIDNIHNFDEFDLTRATSFCDIVDAEFRRPCYVRMGFNLNNQAIDPSEVREACLQLEQGFVDACREGAGLGIES